MEFTVDQFQLVYVAEAIGFFDSCDRFVYPAFPVSSIVRRTVAMSAAGMGRDAQLGRVHNNGEGQSVAVQRRIGEGSASETGSEGEVAKGKSLCKGKGFGARGARSADGKHDELRKAPA